LTEISLKNKVAIVTGAGSGIGKSIAITLASNGAKVILNDINLISVNETCKTINSKYGIAESMVADVGNYKDILEMVEKIVKKHGKVDILVNNAGILGKYEIDDVDEEKWDELMNINLKGVFNCCKAVLEPMRKQKSGRIINISSSAGRTTSTFGGVHYTTAKTGVLGLTRHWAREVAKDNVNVNAICPGEIDTPMIRNIQTYEQLNETIRNIPLKRLGKPEDIANTVLFLASDLADYITGATIDVNGGSLML
tara:strand:+ start:54 stop:812 length:759 start_codon:yes stop_codon:yes gene_type:complete